MADGVPSIEMMKGTIPIEATGLDEMQAKLDKIEATIERITEKAAKVGVGGDDALSGGGSSDPDGLNKFESLALSIDLNTQSLNSVREALTAMAESQQQGGGGE